MINRDTTGLELYIDQDLCPVVPNREMFSQKDEYTAISYGPLGFRYVPDTVVAAFCLWQEAKTKLNTIMIIVNDKLLSNDVSTGIQTQMRETCAEYKLYKDAFYQLADEFLVRTEIEKYSRKWDVDLMVGDVINLVVYNQHQDAELLYECHVVSISFQGDIYVKRAELPYLPPKDNAVEHIAYAKELRPRLRDLERSPKFEYNKSIRDWVRV